MGAMVKWLSQRSVAARSRVRIPLVPQDNRKKPHNAAWSISILDSPPLSLNSKLPNARMRLRQRASSRWDVVLFSVAESRQPWSAQLKPLCGNARNLLGMAPRLATLRNAT